MTDPTPEQPNFALLDQWKQIQNVHYVKQFLLHGFACGCGERYNGDIQDHRTEKLVQAREQASRAETLEQAARVADEFLLRRGDWNSYHQDAQLEIARTIRALLAAEPKEPRG